MLAERMCMHVPKSDVKRAKPVRANTLSITSCWCFMPAVEIHGAVGHNARVRHERPRLCCGLIFVLLDFLSLSVFAFFDGGADSASFTDLFLEPED